MKANKQKGFTLVELLAVLWVIICSIGMIGAIWVICHFVAKFW